MSLPLLAEVRAIEVIARGVKRITFGAATGTALPAFSPGSHILVAIPLADGPKFNAYSLIGDPRANDAYSIAVRLVGGSRGGSEFLHHRLKVGDHLAVGAPANFFPLAKLARKHLLIAGGIGITPIFSHVQELRRLGADYELHYLFRDVASAPFADSPAMYFPGGVHLYDAAKKERLDLAALLSDQPLGTHLYVCGPESLRQAAADVSEGRGWPASHFHCERFTSKVGCGFRVHLKKSRAEVRVEPSRSILETLEGQGFRLPFQCRGGACGKCEVRVLEGQVDHRDFVLGENERRGGQSMMICVSRSAGGDLVLDL